MWSSLSGKQVDPIEHSLFPCLFCVAGFSFSVGELEDSKTGRPKTRLWKKTWQNLIAIQMNNKKNDWSLLSLKPFLFLAEWNCDKGQNRKLEKKLNLN